jgi:multiple sugar transport system ATP-binding protein
VTALTIRNLCKNFGATEVLKGLSFDVEHGDFISLLGPSGCGKSTLLRCIAGLEQTTAGEIEIDGKSVTGVPPAERNLAMVFQSYALYPHLNVRNNMAFGLKLQGMSRVEIERRVKDAAATLHIDQLLDRKPRQLSGGQRQRVAIGRAIVRDPRIFLFDEPLSNLDAALRTQMRQELTRLHKQLGRTMIFVTHDQVEAMTLSNKVVVLNDGVVEQAGPPLDLYHYPANRFVARFIGSPQMNLLPARHVSSKGRSTILDVCGEKLSLPHFNGEATEVGIRPEDLSVTHSRGPGIKATIKTIERLGPESIIIGATASGHDIVARVEGTVTLADGSSLSLKPKAHRVHVFNPEGRRIGGPQLQQKTIN